MPRIIFLIAALFASFISIASDIEREKRIASQIVDDIFDGEPFYLQANGHKFLSIYMESETDKPKGAAIILHGRGLHPDWEQTVHPLRKGLPGHGWHTLSLQMPVLEAKAKYYEYVPIFPESFPRIEAGIKYLQDKGIKNIVLIAHSCSVHMSMAWFEKTGAPEISAYVGIGMGATDYKQPMVKPFPLDKMEIPVLDIYGAEEYPAVIRLAPGRLAAIEKAGNPKSKQLVVSGANHYFTGKGEPLLAAIAQWLDTL